MKASKIISIGSLLTFLAVAIGAFGAHALKSPHMKTYMTGSDYHFIHSLGIIFVGILSKQFQLNLSKTFYAFVIGIVFFSLNCYLYAITGLKVFAMLVPIGGVSFLIGWFFLFLSFRSKA